jgi:Kef-type K+ transport system membrane component KefB
MAASVHLSPTTLLALSALVIVVVPYALWRAPWIRALAPLGIVQLVVALLASRLSMGASQLTLSATFFDPLAWMGVMFFLFAAGGHAGLDQKVGWRQGPLALGVATLALPLAAGVLLGQWLRSAHPEFYAHRSSGAVFDIAVGICLAVTALPVLAILVQDLDLRRSRVGQVAMAVAVMHDIALWVLLGTTLLIAQSADSPAQRVVTALLSGPALVAVLIFVVRPIIARLWERSAKIDRDALVFSSGLLLFGAVISDFIGLHLAIGAFLAGAIAPRSMFERAAAVIEPMSTIVLLPFFFMSAALAIPGNLDYSRFLYATVVVTTTALVVKFVSGALSARLIGFSTEESVTIGSLLQCKGLMEIVAIMMLRDAGIVSGDFVAAFMVMSLVTTLSAKPLVMVARTTSVRLRKRNLWSNLNMRRSSR